MNRKLIPTGCLAVFQILFWNVLITSARAQSCVPAPANIVAWWSAEGDATDRLGNDNGSIGPNTGFETGEVGSAFTFDGQSSYVDLGSPTNLQLENFTIEAWVKRASPTQSSLAVDNATLLGYQNGGYDFGLWGDGRLFLSAEGVNNVDGHVGYTDTSRFHHVAVTKSGATVIFYLDGVATAPISYGTSFTFNSSISIGAAGSVHGGNFLGDIDELAVYSRALSSNEIQGIVNAGPGGKCLSGAPVITSDVMDQSVFAGHNATLSVGVSGDLPMTFQWMFNNSNIIGATNFSLLLTDVQPSQAGLYSVTISNDANFISSRTATLSVNPAPDCEPLPTNMVSWWAGEGNAIDNLGINNGALEGSPSFALGMVGQAFSFNGTAQFVRVTNSPSLQFTNGLTLEAWVFPTSPLDGGAILSKFDVNFVQQSSWRLALNGSGQATLLVTGNGVNEATNVSNIDPCPLNQWSHIAATYDGVTMKTYFNGVLENAVVQFGGIFPGTDDVGIGADCGGTIGASGQFFFAGLIDEPAVYSRALSDSEIQAIFNSGVTGKCPTPPFFTSQPTNETVNFNGNALFSVATGGSQPVFYQWSLNRTNISGATNSTLALTRVQSPQAGIYNVSIENAATGTNTFLSSNAVLTVLPAPPCDADETNLVGWWPAETNAWDNVGGNSGTMSNITFAPGVVGNAFVFNGSNSAIRLGSPPNLQLENFTIEAWIKRASPTISSHISQTASILACGTGGYGFGLWNDGRLFLTQENVGHVDGNVGLTDTNSFHHVAVTESNGTVIFYLDGTPTAPQNYNPNFTFGTPVVIGSDGAANQTSFFGMIDELSVYNRPLSSNEIQTIYVDGLSGIGKCALALPPAIYLQPASQSVFVGTGATLAAAVDGSPLLSYQWQLNQTNIQGATNTTLAITNVQPGSLGSYSFVASNVISSSVSSNVIVTGVFAAILENNQLLTGDQYVFLNSVTINLTNIFPNGDIFYTLDGTTPNFGSAIYSAPFVVSNSSVLQVLAYSPDFTQSALNPPISLIIIPTYTLTATTPGGGAVAENPNAASYPSGTVVTLTATPAAGFHLFQWQGDTAGTNTTNFVLMDRNKSVQAIFGTSLSTTATGGGSVTLDPLGSNYPFGTVVQISAIPQSGNFLALWGNAASGNTNPLSFSLVTANPAVSALFSPLNSGQFTLAVVPIGGGKVAVSPRTNVFTNDQVATVTATPNVGKAFVGWSGDASGTNNPLSVTMTKNKTVFANFTTNNNLSFKLPVPNFADGFEVDLNGEFGSHYRLDASSNLLDWTPLLNLTNIVGTIHFIDTNASNFQMRYYRSVILP